ncbi:MAG: nucleotidyltransferase family protein, partial [Kiloniellales bacterium]
MRPLCDADLLLGLLIRPAVMVELTEPEWEALLPRARACHLLARLAAAARAGGFIGSLPHRIEDHLAAAATVAAHHERTIRWEINRIQRALRNLDVPVVLLKGAAYLAAGLPAAGGRLVGDIDNMVPRHALDAVERA